MVVEQPQFFFSRPTLAGLADKLAVVIARAFLKSEFFGGGVCSVLEARVPHLDRKGLAIGLQEVRVVFGEFGHGKGQWVNGGRSRKVTAPERFGVIG